jgi:hypothetical protein
VIAVLIACGGNRIGDGERCGDGTCSATEIENCTTCLADCQCPTILVCGRELAPPRCILPTTVTCAAGVQPRPITFCLVQPNKPADECRNRFETTVTACSRDEAAAIAQASAGEVVVLDGACPPCL